MPVRKTASKKPTAGKPAQKPPSKATRRKASRTTKVAAAVLAGEPVAAIARQEGVSRQTIYSDMPQARQILAALVDRNIADIEVLFATFITVIREAATANRVEKLADGAKIDMGPDHYARLTAAKRFFELVQAGRPAPKAPEETPNRGITWAELQELVRKTSAG